MRRLLLTISLAAALAGCGGDDALSPADYRNEARTICREADRATDQVERPTRTNNRAIADYFERLLAVNERTSDRFAKLDPPDDLKKAHDDALAANREGVEEVRRLVGELKKGGDARELLQGAQSRLEDLSRRSGDAARRLGVPECASEG